VSSTGKPQTALGAEPRRLTIVLAAARASSRRTACSEQGQADDKGHGDEDDAFDVETGYGDENGIQQDVRLHGTGIGRTTAAAASTNRAHDQRDEELRAAALCVDTSSKEPEPVGGRGRPAPDASPLP